MYTDESLIAFCQRALQTPSFSGRERQMAELMKDKMLELGFDEAVFDRLGNVIGTIHGKRPGKTILMDGHIDTVDVIDEAQWTHGPLSGVIADGKIYGARRLGHEGQRTVRWSWRQGALPRRRRRTLPVRSAFPARSTRNASKASRRARLRNGSSLILSSSARRRPPASRSGSGEEPRLWSRPRA